MKRTSAFVAWFKRYKPDVVMGHFPDAMDWMKSCGAKLPKTHAFVCLNSLRTTGNCAAIDLQTGQLGARATELVIGQLLHNEFGIPTEPSLTTIPGKLISSGISQMSMSMKVIATSAPAKITPASVPSVGP